MILVIPDKFTLLRLTKNQITWKIYHRQNNPVLYKRRKISVVNGCHAGSGEPD